jgi:hypothetical protein
MDLVACPLLFEMTKIFEQYENNGLLTLYLVQFFR